jgi:RNA polymerase sigma factor (sigma-70 family)
VRTIPIPSRALGAPIESKRLLALASDERLVARVRRGSDVAFEVLFERHTPGILSFCRHMLGAREEAEDAVQHTFAAAYRALHRDECEISLKPWLYAIARNRCLSLLRIRREQVEGEWDLPTEGLAEQVEKRWELRELLRDLVELPEQQRAALLLAEVGDLAHADVAAVLGCEVDRVKSLVFQARSGLIRRREARAIPCVEIREQLATLRGGALRRNELRHHLKDCRGCSAFREEVMRQRGMLAAALPVLPSLKLKSGVLAAVGIGGGSAAGGGGAGVVGGALAKVAVAGAVAGGGAAAGTVVVEHSERSPAADPAVRVQPGGVTAASALVPVRAEGRRFTAKVGGDESRRAAARRAVPARRRPARRAGERRGLKRAAERRASNRRERGARGRPAEPAARAVNRGQGTRGASRAGPSQPRGRGPVEAPPESTPVRRGPPDSPPAPGKPAPTAHTAVPAAPAGDAPRVSPPDVGKKATASEARGRQ